MGVGISADDNPDFDVSTGVLDEEQMRTCRGGSIAVACRYCNTRPVTADYSIEPTVIGTGMSGPVRLAISLRDGRKVAVKSFQKKRISMRKKAELKNEVNIYMQLDHPNVAQLEKVYESNDEVHIVMEYMAGGELYARLSKSKRYTEQLAATTTRQMLLAIAYLHANNIVHRDLKLENFLYVSEDSDKLKLIDFGFSKFWDNAQLMEQVCGAVQYMAPEVLNKCYSSKADLWSLGVIVYMLLIGSPPFKGSDADTLRRIKAGMILWDLRFPRLSQPAQDFARQLLVLNPDERLSAEQALEHTFVNEHTKDDTPINYDVVRDLRRFAHASRFKRAVYTIIAWSLTMDERAEVEKLFLALDTEHNGTLSHSELAELFRDNASMDSEEIKRLFDILDSDHDDKIQYNEFLAATLDHRISLHEDVLRKAFSCFDKDQSGMIDVAELKKVLGSSFGDEELAELMAEADTNKDGTISFEEFFEYFQRQEPLPTGTNPKIKLGSVLDNLLPATSISTGALGHPASILQGRRPSIELLLARRASREQTSEPHRDGDLIGNGVLEKPLEESLRPPRPAAAS